jgi:hypothetical protein
MGYCPRQAWCAQAVEAMAVCEIRRCHHDILITLVGQHDASRVESDAINGCGKAKIAR